MYRVQESEVCNIHEEVQGVQLTKCKCLKCNGVMYSVLGSGIGAGAPLNGAGAPPPLQFQPWLEDTKRLEPTATDEGGEVSAWSGFIAKGRVGLSVFQNMVEHVFITVVAGRGYAGVEAV